MINNNPRIGIIGDTHFPYDHPRYIDHCKLIFDRHRCDRIIHIGDVVENQAISYHEKNPDLDNPGRELKKTRDRIKLWHSIFPKMECLIGNHDALVQRKVRTAGLSAEVLKDLPTLLHVPGWTFHDEIIIKAFNHRLWFRHSWNKTAMNAGGSGGFSLICGHHHGEAAIKWRQFPTHSCFSMYVGCGINRKSPAFDYGKNHANQPVISCATIIDGEPHLHRLFV